MTQYITSPEHTFLRAPEVFTRYLQGRNKGYQMLMDDTLPKAIEGRYRRDTLMNWEDSSHASVPSTPPTASRRKMAVSSAPP